MNPNRKPFYPDVIVFYVCIIIAVWFFGYEYGLSQIKGCVVSAVKTYQPTQPAVMYESRGDVKYWRDYTRSLPK